MLGIQTLTIASGVSTIYRSPGSTMFPLFPLIRMTEVCIDHMAKEHYLQVTSLNPVFRKPRIVTSRMIDTTTTLKISQHLH